MVDRTTRRAGLIAALVAVPVALLVGLLSFWAFGDRGGDRAVPGLSPAPSGPQPSSSVPVAAPSLSGDQAAVCRSLVANLPDRVRDRTRRPVTAGTEQNAAYGEPPIVLSCGVPQVSPHQPTDLVYPLDGVCWYVAQSPAGTIWTTLDRQVPVRVTVPKSYDSPGQWVIVLSGPVGRSVPVGENPRYGCRLASPSPSPSR